MITTEKELMAALLATEAGRLFCGLLLQESGAFACPMRATPDATAFAVGEQHVGQRVQQLTWAVDESFPMRCLREWQTWQDDKRSREEKEEVSVDG